MLACLGRFPTLCSSHSRTITSSLYNNIPNPLPATFLRGGTSKGVFLNAAHLPPSRSQWDRIFLGIMGSPDPIHARQLNGMGGGVSSLSKAVVVGPSVSDADADVEYTFAQVGIRDAVVDYSGNCGNLSSMVGAFALAEGLVRPRPTSDNVVTVRALNTNTGKVVHTTFPISSTNPSMPLLDLPQTSIAGVPGTASQIVLEFVFPAGARTGKLFPTGNPTDTIVLHPDSAPVRVSLVDATNPTVFTTATELCAALALGPSALLDYTSPTVLQTLEAIRRACAMSMGLDPAAQAQPKVAVLNPSPDADADIVIHALSMGVLHRAVPMTVGLCLGVAAGMPGTLAAHIVSTSTSAHRGGGMVRMRHPSGEVEVGARFGEHHTVESAKVVRTGRMLMKGVVWW